MRRFIKLSLLSMLFLTVTPVRADEAAEKVRMLRSQAVQSQIQGDPDMALEKYRLALETASDAFGGNAPYLSEIYYDMGSLCLTNSKFKEADDFLNQALKLNPNCNAAHLRLSELKLLQSHFVSQDLQYTRADEAARHALAVLAKHKDDVIAHQELAFAFETKDERRRAYREFAAVDKLIERNRDIYEGKAVPAELSLPSFTPAPAAPAKPKPEAAATAAATAAARKAAELEARKKAEQARKKAVDDALALSRRKAEQSRKDAEARKRAEQDKRNAAAAKKKADLDAKKKAEQEAARKKPRPVSRPSDSGVADDVGVKATLHSKAVLLTPVKKKPAETESAAPEPKKPAPPPAEAAAKKAVKPHEEPKAESKPAAPKPGKHAPGLVPPPPPVIPTYPVMAPPPQAVAPAKPKALPRKEEKPKEPPAQTREDKSGGSDDDDFLLDWGGAKPKGKKKK